MLKYVPLILKQVVRQRTRTLLTVGGVAVAMFLFVAVQAMQAGVRRATQTTARDTTLVVYRQNKFCPATNHDVNDGQELWDKLVSKHENFILTLNGHVIGDGLGRVVTPTPAGRDVPQVLVNFQMKPNGGDGWLRLLEFKADGRTIDAVDYSPTLDRQNVSPQNRFTMTTAPIGNKTARKV